MLSVRREWKWAFTSHPRICSRLKMPPDITAMAVQYVDTVIPTDPASFKSEPTKARKIPAERPGSNVTFACKADSYNRYFLNQLYRIAHGVRPRCGSLV